MASASGPPGTSPLLGLIPDQLASLNDDRVGRCLDRLFDADIPSLTLAVVSHAVREFGVTLDELHNDSTTITFHGDYEAADRERTLAGAAPPGRHLGAQQGPPPRPEAAALHPHRHPRRRRAGAVPRRERQRHRRPLAPRTWDSSAS